jgi:acetyl esterase/lipase
MNAIPGPLSDGTAAYPYAAPRVGPRGDLQYDNIVYSAESGYRPNFLDLRVPQNAGPHPVIIWVHGGGWSMGSRRRLAPNLFANKPHDQMLDAGYAVAAIDYRLVREAGYEGSLLDVKAAVRWLRGHAADFDLDPARVVVWGESAGGHLALMSGLCTKLDGTARTGECRTESEVPNVIVDWYGPTDLTQLVVAGEADADESIYGSEHPAETLRRLTGWSHPELSPISYINSSLTGVPPIFVAHGDADAAVPIRQSRDLVNRLQQAGVTVDYLEVPGAEHVWRGAPSMPEIVAQSLNFVSKNL